MEQSYEMSPSEMLVNMGTGGTLDDFYPSVAIATLMKIIRDPTLERHHNEVVKAVTFIFKVCGQNKKKPKLDEKWKKIIEETQVEASEEFTQCTNVIISDRFALTAAACIEK